MESSEKELLRFAMQHSPAIRRLYERHILLDERVASFGGKKFLTNEEQVEMARLKKEKLLGKERLLRLLDEFKSSHTNGAGYH